MISQKNYTAKGFHLDDVFFFYYTSYVIANKAKASETSRQTGIAGHICQTAHVAQRIEHRYAKPKGCPFESGQGYQINQLSLQRKLFAKPSFGQTQY